MMTAAVMVDPASVGGGEHTAFIAGNHEAAKSVVTTLLHSFGWRDVRDLGDISGARGMEAYLVLWVRGMQAFGTPMFNIKLVVCVRRLTERSLRTAAGELGAADPSLGASLERYGPPPLWAREPSYATLIHLILEQQVSLASAQAAFDKLSAALGSVEPVSLLTLSDEQLRAIGFSRQKAGYARELAAALADGFDLATLERLPDDDVRAALMSHKGIGRSTADIYLTMCLLRPDIWPQGDLALATSARELFELEHRPNNSELAAMADRWHPYRAVAARILWHDYLGRRGLPS